jgi:hypothetical protein
LTDKVGPTRLFRNLKRDEMFLAARQPNDYVVYAVMDENNKPINAGNMLSKEGFADILGFCDIEYQTFTRRDSAKTPSNHIPLSLLRLFLNTP